MLGKDLVGAYLFGSSVLGGLRPDSDLDVLAVSARPTTHDERRVLVERLLAASRRPRPLEVTIVVQPDVRPWRYPPPMDLQYGDWWRAELERGEEPWPSPNPDLATLLTKVLRGGRPLVGPPPGELLDPVPQDDLIRAMTDSVESLLEDQDLERDTRNAVLTLARIWSTLATGDIRAKDDAATWALERLPAQDRLVLERARAQYRGDEHGWDVGTPSEVRAYADYVVAEIRRAVDRTA